MQNITSQINETKEELLLMSMIYLDSSRSPASINPEEYPG